MPSFSYRIATLITLALFAGCAVAGCAVERSGLGVVDGGTSLADAGANVGIAEDASLDLSREDLGLEDLGVDLGASCVPADCPGLRCDPRRDACSHHPSCLSLRDDDRIAPLDDGLYEIDPDGDGDFAPLEVYCDMNIAGGGWTLVGRTEGSREEAFGWTTPFGAVDDDSNPYSFGHSDVLAFTEVMIGKRGGGKNWGDRVYRFSVPVGFVSTYASSAYALTDVRTERGSCMPVGGPRMFSYAGFTSANDHFFFRDNDALDRYGMRADEFETNYNDCGNGGDIDRTEGMIMVR